MWNVAKVFFDAKTASKIRFLANHSRVFDLIDPDIVPVYVLFSLDFNSRSDIMSCRFVWVEDQHLLLMSTNYFILSN